MTRLIGLSLAMLNGSDLREAADRFWRLQEQFSLSACEIHSETALFPAALMPGDGRFLDVCRGLRQSVSILGLHLPFVDLNPVSANPRVVRMSLEVMQEALDKAAEIAADYVVFHARGRHPSGERNRELSAWREILNILARRAAERNLRFLLENADDLRRPTEVAELAEAAGTEICLDIGHLYERVYDDPAWTVGHRAAARFQDIFSPRPFLLRSNLPIADAGGVDELIRTLGKRIACVHLHNHNGRQAHRTLSQGTVPWRRLLGHRGLPATVPVILEADYRGREEDFLAGDLRSLTDQLRQGT